MEIYMGGARVGSIFNIQYIIESITNIQCSIESISNI